MMYTLRLGLLLGLVTVSNSGPLFGCPQPPGYGYIISSELEDHTRGPFPVITVQVGQTLGGNWLLDSVGAQGSTASWQNDTDSTGKVYQLGKRTPAQWRLFWITGVCSPFDAYRDRTKPTYVDITLQPDSTPYPLTCFRTLRYYQASPQSLQTGVGAYVTVAYDGGYTGSQQPTQYSVYDSSGYIWSSGAMWMADAFTCAANIQVNSGGYMTAYMLDAGGNGAGAFTLFVNP